MRNVHIKFVISISFSSLSKPRLNILSRVFSRKQQHRHFEGSMRFRLRQKELNMLQLIYSNFLMLAQLSMLLVTLAESSCDSLDIMRLDLPGIFAINF